VNNPSPTEVSNVPRPRVAPCDTTTSSVTPLPASSGLSVDLHGTKLDAALPVANTDGDVVMQEMTSTLRNNKESSVRGSVTDSAATIPVESVDGDVVMQQTTSTSSQLRNDNDLPVWLSLMITYLRRVSEDVAWQGLVTEFVDFERRGPSSGVSFLALIISALSNVIHRTYLQSFDR